MKKPRSTNRPEVPWAKRQELPDPQVKDAADQYEAARRLIHDQPPGTGVLLPLMNSAAVAVELYLKSLSAELIHVADTEMPEVSRVFAQPAGSSGRAGHMLVRLLETIPEDVRSALERAWHTGPGSAMGADLPAVLESLEGVFQATRYPFEQGHDLSRYSLSRLMGTSQWLSEYVAQLQPRDRIQWKDSGEPSEQS